MSRAAEKPDVQKTSPAHARADIVSHTLTKTPVGSALDNGVEAARDALISRQAAQGYWLFELEADCTIPAEYIMMMHFLDEIDAGLERKLAVYLRTRQSAHGGWPLYHGGEFNMSCSVKAYYALKLAGDDPQSPHMSRAREAILQRGGAARSNVFTRIALALFGQLPWRGVPYIPVEIMLLPKWFPFHIDKVAYWSRTVMVPLFILCTRKPVAKNPRGVSVRELFTTPPEEERRYFRDAVKQGGLLARVFLAADRLGRLIDPLDSATHARARHAARGKLDARAAERRGWLGGHFPGHGERLGGDDHSRLSDHGPATGHREARAAEAAGGGCPQRLLPTLRVARLGHRPRELGDAGGRRCGRLRRRDACPRLAANRASARRAGRLAGQSSGGGGRRMGVPVRESALPRSRRHRRCGLGHASSAQFG